MMPKLIPYLSALLLLISLYSYKLLDVPTGLTLDEASFGYNATLLSQTAHDQNGRFLPVFVLTSDGHDWRQPVTQYYYALLFFIFGPSVFLLRFASVLIAAISTLMIYYLARKLIDQNSALIAAAVFALSPLVYIQSHLGLDNIVPVPFALLWLIAFYHYSQTKSRQWLIISAVSLGLAFYSYKGMRAIVPVWTLTSLFWLYSSAKQNKFKAPSIFFFSLLPFFLIIPILERLYAGATLGNSRPVYNHIYEFFLPYLSSFDPSYLFVKGDLVANHSTDRHGVLLLASLPLIILGTYASFQSKNKFWRFITISLFLAPLLYGLVGSVHRYSRLMALLPLYSLLAGLGWQALFHFKSLLVKPIAFLLLLLTVLNFTDFFKFYFTTYPGVTYSLVGELDYHLDVKQQSLIAKKQNLTPLTHGQVTQEGGDALKFYQAVYFGEPLQSIPNDEPTPPGSILMTQRAQVPGMVRVGDYHGYYLQIRE